MTLEALWLPPPGLALTRQATRVATPPLRYAPLATLLHDDPLMNSKRVRCQRRRMNKGVRRHNARAVEEMTSSTVPGRIPALRVCTSTSEKGSTISYSHGQTGQPGKIWRRFHCVTPAATRARPSGGRQRRRVRTKRSTRVRGGISNQTPAAHQRLRIVARHAIGVESGKEE